MQLIDRVNHGVWGYRDLVGPVEQQEGPRLLCGWHFEQFLLADGSHVGDPFGSNFTLALSVEPAASPCDEVVPSVFVGIGDCAGEFLVGGIYVRVGDVNVWSTWAGASLPDDQQTLRAIQTDLASRLAAAIGRLTPTLPTAAPTAGATPVGFCLDAGAYDILVNIHWADVSPADMAAIANAIEIAAAASAHTDPNDQQRWAGGVEDLRAGNPPRQAGGLSLEVQTGILDIRPCS